MKLGQGDRGTVAARNIKQGQGDITLAICESFEAGQGAVRELIVFKSVKLGQGDISELHCLSSTEIEFGQSDVEPHYHDLEELVAMAKKAAKIK